MRVLVTGGAGFIGSNIVDKLIQQGCKVSIIDNLSTGNQDNLNEQAVFYNLDIRDKRIDEVFEAEKPEYVIHHAAQIDVQKSIGDPAFDGDVNIIGTVNLLDNCKRFGVKKLIYASSAAVYGPPEYLPVDELHKVEPISFYGISKHTPEHYIKVFAQLYDIRYSVLRYANVYGIRQDPKGEGGVISIFMNKLFNGESPTIFGDGEQTRDFIYVEDVVDANIQALTYGDGEMINVGTNSTVTVNELYAIMKEVFGLNYSANYAAERKGDIRHSCLDNSKAGRLLHWKPKYSIKEGIGKTIQYYTVRL